MCVKRRPRPTGTRPAENGAVFAIATGASAEVPSGASPSLRAASEVVPRGHRGVDAGRRGFFRISLRARPAAATRAASRQRYLSGDVVARSPTPEKSKSLVKKNFEPSRLNFSSLPRRARPGRTASRDHVAPAMRRRRRGVPRDRKCKESGGRHIAGASEVHAGGQEDRHDRRAAARR